jgi:PBP1b-binding outer membrane lipoprotein LpoB
MFGKKKGLNYLRLFTVLVLVSMVFLSSCSQKPPVQSEAPAQQPEAQTEAPIQQEQQPVVLM